ncbi:MAG: YgjP-like metallopeptidase domain-containing protein [Bacteroidales bacterium]
MQKTFSHIGIGEVVYTKRLRCKAIKISVSCSRGVRVSLPFYASYSNAVNFVDENLAKIVAVLQKQEKKNEELVNTTEYKLQYTLVELKEIKKRAHAILPQRLETIAKQLNSTIIVRNNFGIKKASPFNYGRVAIKNNRTNWGSCSSVGNINLNMHLVNLPNELIDFVIIHELCHLVYHNHSPRFHELVNLACEGRENELSKKVKGIRMPTCLTH